MLSKKSNVSMINKYYLLGVQKTSDFYPLHRQSILIHYRPCFGSSSLVQSFEGRMQNLYIHENATFVFEKVVFFSL